MSNALQVFKYQQKEIRTLEIDGEAWFAGKDIAEALGYTKNTRKAIRDHVDERDRKPLSKLAEAQNVPPLNGGYADMVMINESGMYSLILSSKLPSAKEFKHWVTSEVLPSIARHGMFMTDKAMDAFKNDPEAFNLLLKQYVAEQEKNRELQKRINQTAGYTVLGQIVMARNDAFTFQEAAQFLCEHGFDIGQNRLFKYCREKKLLCSRRGRQWNHPLQSAVARGLLNIQVSGDKRARTITMILPRGLQYLANELSKEFYPIFALEIDD